MRRRHRNPLIWGSASCGLFCQLWRMNARVCVGTVVNLYRFWRALVGSWRFFADSCQVCLAGSAMFVVLLLNTTIESKKRCQGILNIIQNLVWKGPTMIKNETYGCFGASGPQVGSRTAFWEHHVELFPYIYIYIYMVTKGVKYLV